MNVPVEISFRELENTQALEDYIRQRLEKLEKVFNPIVSCRIAVERPQKHPEAGSGYRVRLDVRLPHGHEVVVRREPHEGSTRDDLRTVLKEAFDAARRELREVAERSRGDVKTHPEQMRRVVGLGKRTLTPS